MRDTLPLLEAIPFPALRRGRLDTLQVNVGYRCNQSCVHCHVNAGPNRTEEKRGDVADLVNAGIDVDACRAYLVAHAPQLVPDFDTVVEKAAAE